MSEHRDPERDQPLPNSGHTDVQEFIINNLTTQRLDIGVYRVMIHALIERRAYGCKKYGRPLQTFNGRDWLLDMWEEAVDAYCYAMQGLLEWQAQTGEINPRLMSVVNSAESMFRELTELRLERGDFS